MRGLLSNRGLPRPLEEHDDTLRPVPWSQGSGWGVADEARQRIAQQQSRCLVCGEPVQEGIVFVRTDKSDMVVAPEATPLARDIPPLKDEYDINDLPPTSRVVEGAMHTGCAKLTRAHCKPARLRLNEGIWIERAYKRGRYKSGQRPQIEYA